MGRYMSCTLGVQKVTYMYTFFFNFVALYEILFYNCQGAFQCKDAGLRALGSLIQRLDGFYSSLIIMVICIPGGWLKRGLVLYRASIVISRDQISEIQAQLRRRTTSILHKYRLDGTLLITPYFQSSLSPLLGFLQSHCKDTFAANTCISHTKLLIYPCNTWLKNNSQWDWPPWKKP